VFSKTYIKIFNEKQNKKQRHNLFFDIEVDMKKITCIIWYCGSD